MRIRVALYLLALTRVRGSKEECGEKKASFSMKKEIQVQMLYRAERQLAHHQRPPMQDGEEACPTSIDRRYCEECSLDRVTMLWSFPGSGNTFVRTLIESATAVYSGSVYKDKNIAREMPGERRGLATAAHCASLSVIKAHPGLYADTIETTCNIPIFPGICEQKIFRAIFLVRHPLSAAWAEFQRRKLNSHSKALSSMNKHSSLWTAWTKRGPALIDSWASLWRPGGRYYEWIRAYRAFHILRFEDLLVPSLRHIELKSALAFAGISHLVTTNSLLCAFDSHLTKAFHRKDHKKSSPKLTNSRLWWQHALYPRDIISISARDAWKSLSPETRDHAWLSVQAVAQLLGYYHNSSSHSIEENESYLLSALQEAEVPIYGSSDVAIHSKITPLLVALRNAASDDGIALEHRLEFALLTDIRSRRAALSS